MAVGLLLGFEGERDAYGVGGDLGLSNYIEEGERRAGRGDEKLGFALLI